MNKWISGPAKTPGPAKTITMGITIQRKVPNYCAKKEIARLNAGRDDKFLTLRLDDQIRRLATRAQRR